METERAPGNRELITRGPEGSTVRSNIRPMVQEPVYEAADRARWAPHTSRERFRYARATYSAARPNGAH